MFRGVWRRMRRVLDQNVVFVPVLIVAVVFLLFVFTRLLRTPAVVVPQQAIATPSPSGRTPTPLDGPPPNVVVIVANDQRAEDVRVMPNVQRLLADRGVTFTRAFATTPLGSPARATILTGQDAFKSGVWDNDPPQGGIYTFKHRSTIATWLRQDGFETSYVGLYLAGYRFLNREGFVPPGWDDWHAIVEGGYYGFSLDENGDIQEIDVARDAYVTDVLAERAETFVEGAERPFFLHLASFALQPPAQPAARDALEFRDEPPLRPPSYNVQASEGTPAAEQPELSAGLARYVDNYRRNSLGAAQALDQAVQRIVDAVEQRGELDNTVFIYTSDKGMLLGEHRIFNVAWPYEPAIHIPLIVRAPGIDPARTDDRLVTNADIAPTIAELTGVRTRVPQDGMSLAPILRGEDVEWRDAVRISYLGERFRSNFPPRYRAVRTDRYKLIVYEDDDDARELFDLERDPHELNNLAGTEAGAEVEEMLLARLDEMIPEFPALVLPLPTPLPTPDASPDESQD